MVIKSEIILLKSYHGKASFEEFDAKFDKDGSPLAELLTHITNGNFESVFTHSITKQIITSVPFTSQLDELQTKIPANVKAFIKDGEANSCAERQLVVLCVAVALLQFFVQNNWVGPLSAFDSSSLILENKADTDDEQKKLLHLELVDKLSTDGEVCYQLIKQASSFYLARMLLFDCQDFLPDCQTADIWRLHCHRLMQGAMKERSFTLKKSIMELIQKISQKEFLKAAENRDLLIEFHLEAAYSCFFYYRYKDGWDHMNKAEALTQLSIDFSGILGKKTRFQVDEIAQLVLIVEREGELASESPCGSLPVDVALDDDTLLEHMKLSERLTTEQAVTMIEQAVLLGKCFFNKRYSPNDEMTAEQTLAYIEYIIPRATNWCTKFNALLLRSKEEWVTYRKKVRSMMQMEELVKQYSKDEPCVNQRLVSFHSVDMMPIWLVKREYADVLFKMGNRKTALEIFEQLQLWEDVILCYAGLGRSEKAEHLIREQLAVKETAILYCYLGDITQDIENYNKAWEISNHRSARAMRSLGYHYMKKEQYEECIACFDKTLLVNHLQKEVWFTYGCAASLVGNRIKDAVRAFHCVVDIDPDSAQAWNNLGSLYVKMNKKPDALAMYKEAVKYDYENWRMWQNLMVTATDCGDFGSTLRAYHRLVDIKEKFTDAEVLRILVKAVNENIQDYKNVSGISFRKAVQELFGKITSKITNEAEVWQNYAELISGKPELTQEDKEKAAQYLQKAHRCITQQPSWQKDPQKCCSVLGMTVRVAESYRKCCESLNDNVHARKLLSSARLMVKGILSNVKQAQTDPVTGTLNSAVEKSVKSLESSMDVIVELLEKQTQQ